MRQRQLFVVPINPFFTFCPMPDVPQSAQSYNLRGFELHFIYHCFKTTRNVAARVEVLDALYHLLFTAPFEAKSPSKPFRGPVR